MELALNTLENELHLKEININFYSYSEIEILFNQLISGLFEIKSKGFSH